MGMFSAFKGSVVAVLLGIVGLCAGPVGAQKTPRLLFLGISKDGRPSLTAENAVQLRLGGLDVSVMRRKEIPASPCEQADCLASALSTVPAELALVGRILKSEHACLATLWLTVAKSDKKPTEQEIICRSDAKEDELDASLADSAATMIEDYLKDRKLRPNPETEDAVPIINDNKFIQLESKRIWKWDWKRKSTIIVLGLLFAGSLAATTALAARDQQIACRSGEPCFTAKNITDNYTIVNSLAYSYKNETIITGAVSGIFATGFGIAVLVR
ncbi:MAG TPA: hypothetical protein PLW65_05225 [Pseudomonadota bacterium]|nr:hypothetical protein [Pseudomonadota bacterium]